MFGNETMDRKTKGEYYGAYFEGQHIRNLTVISSASVTTLDGPKPRWRSSSTEPLRLTGDFIQSGGIHALISGTGPAKAAQPVLTLTIKTGEIIASNYIVFAKHNANGNTFINIEGGTITERQESDEVPLGEPAWSHGDVSGAVVGWNQTTGDVTIAVSGGTISTAGERNHGVIGFKGRPNKRNSNSLGVLPSGKIKIDLTGGTITTAARGGHGIYAVHGGTGNIEITKSGDEAPQITAKGSGIVALMSADENAEGRIIITHGGNSITAGTNGIFAWAQRRSGYSKHTTFEDGTESESEAKSIADDVDRDEPMILITSSGDITSGSTEDTSTFRFKVDDDDYRGAAWEAADKALDAGNAAIKALAIDHYEIAEYIGFAESFSEDFTFGGEIPEDAALSEVESALIAAVLGGGDVEAALSKLGDEYDDDFRNKIREFAASYNAGNIKIEVTGGTVESTDGDGVQAGYVFKNAANGGVTVLVAEDATVTGKRDGIRVFNAGIHTPTDGSGAYTNQKVTVSGKVTGTDGAGINLIGGGHVTVSGTVEGASGIIFNGGSNNMAAIDGGGTVTEPTVPASIS